MFLLTDFSVGEGTEFGAIFENSELIRTRQNAEVLSIEVSPKVTI